MVVIMENFILKSYNVSQQLTADCQKTHHLITKLQQIIFCAKIISVHVL